MQARCGEEKVLNGLRFINGVVLVCVCKGLCLGLGLCSGFGFGVFGCVFILLVAKIIDFNQCKPADGTRPCWPHI